MKIHLTFKDPDGVYESVKQAVEDDVQATVEGIDDDEHESIVEQRRDDVMEAISPWIEYGEYCRIEIDTEAGTAIVKKVRP